jgi:thioredoxin reductase (NADPH)
LVLEDDDARARWIPTSHNIPGFAAGIGGAQLLATMRTQAIQYGTEIRCARVSSVTLQDGLFALATTSGEPIRTRYLLLATGIKDHLPALPGATEAVMRSLLRFCPICDAFEAIDRRIAVIGDGAAGEREAQFLRTYSAHVTLIHLGGSGFVPHRQELEAKGIEWIAAELSDLKVDQNRISLCQIGKNDRDFDVAYLALGCSPQHQLAKDLNAACDENGTLIVTAHQETSVPHLYAAGDLVRGLNQVIVAAAEGAIAATDIHNSLRRA